MADGDDEATVSAWLRRENTSLLAKNKQLRVELKQAENTAAGGIDVDALRQKIARQGREIEELQGKAAASDEVAALQQQLEAKDAERDAVADLSPPFTYCSPANWRLQPPRVSLVPACLC
eukprot:SAG11_NODE_592_length_8310_cov_3.191868_6_plen_120_part_00